MKLAEVLSVPDPEAVREPWEKYVNRLRQKEQKRRVGRGAFAHVFQHPTYKNIVVKVAQRGSNALEYIKYATENQHNPYVPKIYGVRTFHLERDAFGGYYLVFMEKLKNYQNLPPEKKREILFYHIGLPALKHYLERRESVRDLFMWADRQQLLADLVKAKKSPHLISLLEYFLKIHASDLHDGNIMLRGEDQIVFTDPAV